MENVFYFSLWLYQPLLCLLNNTISEKKKQQEDEAEIHRHNTYSLSDGKNCYNNGV